MSHVIASSSDNEERQRRRYIGAGE